jgi:hypothetical protein
MHSDDGANIIPICKETPGNNNGGTQFPLSLPMGPGLAPAAENML